jgi:hypothetical protein
MSLENRESEILSARVPEDGSVHYPRHVSQLQPQLYRQYRGVARNNYPLASSSQPKIDSSEKTETFNKIFLNQKSQVVEEQLAKIHIENMRFNLERRLAAAKANGDERLICLLEKEFQQLSLI